MGHLVTLPGTSPENKFTIDDGQHAAVSVGANMDMELIWDLFTQLHRRVRSPLRRPTRSARARKRTPPPLRPPIGRHRPA